MAIIVLNSLTREGVKTMMKGFFFRSLLDIRTTPISSLTYYLLKVLENYIFLFYLWSFFSSLALKVDCISVKSARWFWQAPCPLFLENFIWYTDSLLFSFPRYLILWSLIFSIFGFCFPLLLQTWALFGYSRWWDLFMLAFLMAFSSSYIICGKCQLEIVGENISAFNKVSKIEYPSKEHWNHKKIRFLWILINQDERVAST